MRRAFGLLLILTGILLLVTFFMAWANAPARFPNHVWFLLSALLIGLIGYSLLD